MLAELCLEGKNKGGYSIIKGNINVHTQVKCIGSNEFKTENMLFPTKMKEMERFVLAKDSRFIISEL